MSSTEALDIIKRADSKLYNWIIANSRSISNQTIILYAKYLVEKGYIAPKTSDKMQIDGVASMELIHGTTAYHCHEAEIITE